MLPEPFQAIARRLEGLPLEVRQEPWEAFLDGREDRDEIIRALAAADPDGPQPEAREEDDDANEWGPIRLGTIPPAEPFPIDVLPWPIARLVTEGTNAIGCPPDFLAVPALAIAGGVIGRSISLKLKGNYFASSCLFAACVGPPSDGKTPAFKAVTSAVKRIDEILEDQFKNELARWEEEASQPTAEGKKRPKPPPRPKPRRIDVDDITMENIPLILADNPRGLVRITDELTSIMLGMNQFKGGKGNDRPTLLKIWSGDGIKKDRVNHEDNIPIRCPHPCLSIVGGLPPDMLGSMVDSKGRSDGFLDRFLFAYPESLPIPGWSNQGITDETAEEWRELVARLWTRPMNVKEGRYVPHVCFLTPDGENAWSKHYNNLAAEMNAPDFPPAMRGPWGKMREYAGRLVLILACVHYAADAADPTVDQTGIPRVDARMVEYAWRLVAYFKAHSRRVHQTIALGPGSGGDAYKAIVGWIRKGVRSSFSESEIKQARRWITDEDLAEALGALIRRNAIRMAPSDKPTGGRPRGPGYLVNPALLDPENPRNP